MVFRYLEEGEQKITSSFFFFHFTSVRSSFPKIQSSELCLHWHEFYFVCFFPGGLGSDALDLDGDGAVVGDELGVGTVGNDTAAVPHRDVLVAGEPGETPLLGDDDLLTTGELELATTERLNDGWLVGVLAAHGNEDLADVNTGDGSLRLTPSTPHAGLEPVVDVKQKGKHSVGKHSKQKILKKIIIK